jgi:hypothetical protein
MFEERKRRKKKKREEEFQLKIFNNIYSSGMEGG